MERAVEYAEVLSACQRTEYRVCLLERGPWIERAVQHQNKGMRQQRAYADGWKREARIATSMLSSMVRR